MNETTVLLSVGDLQLTAYSLLLAIGALLAILLTACLGKKRIGVDASLSLCLAVLPGAVIGARLVYCATMIESILVDFDGASFIPRIWEGGFTLYGAILGGMISALIYARATHRKIPDVLDLLAPGSALVLCVARAAEYFTSQGLGDYIEDEAFQRFPFAVEANGSWQMPVFMYEAVAAAIILIVVLCLLHQNREPGRTAEVFLVLLSLSQIILESWREDEFIRFGFVRWNQIAAAITLTTVLVLRLIRKGRPREKSRKIWTIMRVVLYLVGVALIILIEFALDKSSIENTLLYGVMAGTLMVMGVAMLKD